MLAAHLNPSQSRAVPPAYPHHHPQRADVQSGQELARFLRQTFAERYQGMLSGSLRALDGAVLQHVLGKLNEEERQRERGGGPWVLAGAFGRRTWV
jgi:hypothetical protein